MKIKLNLIAAPALMLVLCAGIMRDDVAETAYLNLGKEKQFDCVGKVLIDNKFTGSCVLIGKKYVLSASHIFKRYTFKLDTMVMDGNTVVLNKVTGSTNVAAEDCSFSFNGVPYKGKNIHIYTDKQTGKESHDMILIELAEEVTNVSPAYLNTKLNELKADVVGVGYGASGFGGKPAEVKRSQLKIGGENVVDSLGGAMLNGVPSLLICDFDSPTRPELNRIGSAVPKKLEYICSGGDSGGGLFRKNKGRWELIGICASAEAGITTIVSNGYYGSLMMWSRIALFNRWISDLLIG